MQITAIYPVIIPEGTGDGETGTYFEIRTGAIRPNLPSIDVNNLLQISHIEEKLALITFKYIE